jgi:ribonuclease P protein subunit RPR2
MNLNEVARGRCEKLFGLAAQVLDSDEKLAKRYVALARKIAARHRLPLGNKAFCKKCGLPWVPGKTVRVRLQGGRSGGGKTVLYTCVCKNSRRFPYSRKSK